MKFPVETLGRLVDREAIRDCLYRYTRGIDRCDVETLSTVFWPGASVQVGSTFRGTGEELIEMVIAAFRGMDQTMHMFGNILMQLEKDVALVETYAHCYHRLRNEADIPFDVVVGVRYLDRFEKRQAEWRVANRVLIYDWFREYPDSGDWSKGFLGQFLDRGSTLGARKPEDRLYRLLFGSKEF